jgi:hypothetical protein
MVVRMLGLWLSRRLTAAEGVTSGDGVMAMARQMSICCERSGGKIQSWHQDRLAIVYLLTELPKEIPQFSGRAGMIAVTVRDHDFMERAVPGSCRVVDPGSGLGRGDQRSVGAGSAG